MKQINDNKTNKGQQIFMKICPLLDYKYFNLKQNLFKANIFLWKKLLFDFYCLFLVMAAMHVCQHIKNPHNHSVNPKKHVSNVWLAW